MATLLEAGDGEARSARTMERARARRANRMKRGGSLSHVVLQFTTMGPSGSKPPLPVVVTHAGLYFRNASPEGGAVEASLEREVKGARERPIARITYRDPSYDDDLSTMEPAGPLSTAIPAAETPPAGDDHHPEGEESPPLESTSFILEGLGEKEQNGSIPPQSSVGVAVCVDPKGLNRSREWPLVDGTTFILGMSVATLRVGKDTPRTSALHFSHGPLAGSSFPLQGAGISLGRSSDNDIAIPDKELSRKHCRIDWIEEEGGGDYYLRDLGSLNRTYMQLVGPYAGPWDLCIGEHIILGRTGYRVDRYDCGSSERRGARPTMEDQCIILQSLGVRGLSEGCIFPQTYAGVYDGHGGGDASAYLRDRLHKEIKASLMKRTSALHLATVNLKRGGFAPIGEDTLAARYALLDLYVKQALIESFRNTDLSLMKSGIKSGSTATTVLIIGNRLYCANVGDSRTIIGRKGKAAVLSMDHTPQRADEVERIKNAGGFVAHRRVMGELAVSRSFGDIEYKRKMEGNAGVPVTLVSAEPEFSVMQLGPNDEFVILACDGIWDVYTNDELISLVEEEMNAHGSVQQTVHALTDKAISERHTRDNVTAVLLLLKPWRSKAMEKVRW